MQHEIHQLYKDEEKTVPFDPIVSAASIRWGNTTLEGAMTEVVNAANSQLSILTQKAEESAGSLAQILYEIGQMRTDGSDAALIAKIAAIAAVVAQLNKSAAQHAICADSSNNQSDYDLTDPLGHVLIRLLQGHVVTKNFDSRNVATMDYVTSLVSGIVGGGVRTATTSVADAFDICDERGNVVIRIQSGHVYTKYFDSSNIQHPESGGGGGSSEPSQPQPSTVTAATLSRYYGKKIAVLGDSITRGYSNGEYGNINTFTNRLREYYNATILGYASYGTKINKSSYGIGGSTIANLDAAHNPFCLRYTDVSTNADLVLVFGGVNDFDNDIPIGSRYTTTKHDDKGRLKVTLNEDNTTFYGALNVLAKGLQTRFPTKQIYFMTPVHFGYVTAAMLGDRYTNKQGHHLYDYVNAIKDVAADFGIPVIDLYSESGLDPNVEANRLAYFNHKWGGDHPNTNDSLHPDENGHGRIFETIIKTLR